MNPAVPIIETDTGYLVSGSSPFEGLTLVDRVNGDGLLSCKCLEAANNPLGSCSHILAVEQYQKSADSIDQASIDKLLYVVRKLEAEVADNEASARQQLEEVESWLERVNSKLEAQRSYILAKCRQWLEISHKRSIRLVNGTLKLRKRQDKLEILDPDTVLADSRFQREIPAKIEIDKKAIREHFKSTGEIPGGADLIPQEDQFSWECPKLTKGVR